MMVAHWFTQLERGGFPIERVLGAYDLSLLHVAGEWQWLVRRDGRDIAARDAVDAQRQAEAVALQLFSETG